MRLYAIATLVAFSVLADAQRRTDHNYDLQDVAWHISLVPEERAVNGEVTNTLAPLQDNTQSVVFDAGKLQVSKVTVNGDPAAFTAEKKLLTVKLPHPARRGEKLAVRILYRTVP